VWHLRHSLFSDGSLIPDDSAISFALASFKILYALAWGDPAHILFWFPMASSA
jgi:hypothetical protein